ncbi:MAG: M48 family metalloprotease [Synechocystis sp.]|nr:M48 family metalloprotease [Synechocystis sp.]
MIPPELIAKLDHGLKALQNQEYDQAIASLETVCRRVPNQGSQQFLQAKMALVRAYRGIGNLDQSRELCESLVDHPNAEVQNWARTMMLLLLKQEAQGVEGEGQQQDDVLSTELKAGRADSSRVKVALPRVADSFQFTVGIALLVPVLTTALLFAIPTWFWGIQDWQKLLEFSLGFSLLFNLLFLFFSTIIVDRLNERVLGTQWGNLGTIQKYSPEAGELLLRVSRAEKIPVPKLGVIPDNRPVIFAYGVSRKVTRIVASQGIFRYLTADEIATLYAHELGHILRRDCGLMTWVSGWGQLCYWGYCELQHWRGLRPAIAQVAVLPLIWLCLGGFYLNQLANRYFSRTREYYADHFAVNITGNPNALIRALVKMSRAFVKQERQAESPALFLEGLRHFVSYDPLTAAACERGERFNPKMVGDLLLWDWGSPWRGVVTWISSHPLLGKRLQVLSHYAEQLDLDTEYNLILSRRQISVQAAKQRSLFFGLEILIWLLPLWSALALFWFSQRPQSPLVLPGYRGLLIGAGLGVWVRTAWQSLGQRKVAAPTVLSVLSDPNLSPIWGTQVHWQGKLRLVQASIWGRPKLYFHDRTGVVPVRYPFWVRVLPPFLSPQARLDALTQKPCQVSGMAVRGLSPQLQVSSITQDDDALFLGYPLFLSWFGGLLLILLGGLLP